MIDLRLETETSRAITYMHTSSSFLIPLKLTKFAFLNSQLQIFQYNSSLACNLIKMKIENMRKETLVRSM